MNTALTYLKSRIGKDARGSVSPLMEWLNPVLLEAEEGSLKLRYTVRHEMTNPMGNLHGGIAAAIVDDAVGATVFSFGEGFFYASVNLTIDYLWSVKEGEEVIAITHVLKKGRQLINAQCELWNADRSRMIARGYTNLIKTEQPKPA